MFLTDPEMEWQVPEQLLDEDQKVWRAIRLTPSLRWFSLVMREQDGDEPITTLYADPNLLASTVYLTPNQILSIEWAHFDGAKNHWASNTVDEIWLYAPAQSLVRVPLFRAGDDELRDGLGQQIDASKLSMNSLFKVHPKIRASGGS